MSKTHDDWFAGYMTSVRDDIPHIEHGSDQHVTVIVIPGAVPVLSEGHLGSPAAVAVSDVPAGWSPCVEPSVAAFSDGMGCFQGTCIPEWYTLPNTLPRWDPIVCALPGGVSSPHLLDGLTHETRWESAHGFDHLAGL